MAAYVKNFGFVEDIAEGIHNLATGTLAVYLTTQAAAPTQGGTVLAGITQIATRTTNTYPNLSTLVIGAPTSSAQASGTYKLVLPDLVLTASGAVATFRWVGIFNDTPTSPLVDPLICYFDYGADVTLANGETFTLDFDGTNGLLQIV
jgi:hypothetical protein